MTPTNLLSSSLEPLHGPRVCLVYNECIGVLGTRVGLDQSNQPKNSGLAGILQLPEFTFDLSQLSHSIVMFLTTYLHKPAYYIFVVVVVQDSHVFKYENC